jgi:tetratricopeptide (TPR) repeat protein
LQAINYYKEAVRAEENNSLRYDMAELQMRLKTFDKAEKTIMQALQIEQGGGEGQTAPTNNDLQALMNQARFLGLLARVQERAGNLEAAMSTLSEVKSLRSRVLKRVQVEQPDAVLEQRHLAAAACHQMAEHAVLQRNYAAAISHYKEALQLDSEDGAALCALARLYLMNDDLDQCQYTCMTLLRYTVFKKSIFLNFVS